MPKPDPTPAYLTLELAIAIGYALGRYDGDTVDDATVNLRVDVDTLLRRLAFDDGTAYAARIGVHFTDAERHLIRDMVDAYLPDGALKTSVFDAIPDPEAPIP